MKGKKDMHTERSFLEGIKGDIESDLSEIDQIINGISTRLTTFKAVDPDYRLDFSTQESSIDTTKVNVYVLFGTSQPFYSTSDTYNSLITVGKSNLIKNIQLFQNIQKLYDDHKKLNNINLRAAERSDDFSLKYSYEKRYWTFKELIEKSDKKLIADLAYVHDVYRLYLRQMISSKDQMKEILREIEIELK